MHFPATLKALCLTVLATQTQGRQIVLDPIRTFLDSTNDFSIALPGQFVMLGDSITQYSNFPLGTGQALSDWYQRKLDVVNRGYAGWTARHLRYAIPHIFTSNTPIQVVLLWIGANDMAMGRTKDEYAEDLRHLINEYFTTRPTQLKTFYSPVLLLMSPQPRLDVALTDSRGFVNAAKEVADQMSKLYPEKIAFIETHDTLINELNQRFPSESYPDRLKRFLPDGVHPNAEGYQFLTQLVVQAISSAFPEISAQRLPVSFPIWPGPVPSKTMPPAPRQPVCSRVKFAHSPNDSGYTVQSEARWQRA